MVSLKVFWEVNWPPNRYACTGKGAPLSISEMAPRKVLRLVLSADKTNLKGKEQD